jgi:hypothetical protein
MEVWTLSDGGSRLYALLHNVTRTEPEPVKPAGPTSSKPRPVQTGPLNRFRPVPYGTSFFCLKRPVPYGTGFFLPMRPVAEKVREFLIFFFKLGLGACMGSF